MLLKSLCFVCAVADDIDDVAAYIFCWSDNLVFTRGAFTSYIISVSAKEYVRVLD